MRVYQPKPPEGAERLHFCYYKLYIKIYFRDKDSKKIEDNDYLCEVSNIGEILRYIVKKYGYNNSIETYKRILKKL